VKYMSVLVLSASFLGLASAAAAHPHETDKLSELREKSQDLADKAKASGDAIIDSDMVNSMADLLSGLAARVEVEKGGAAGTALWIDGDELIRFNGSADDVLSVTGVGKNLTVEREVIIKDGQTRTRIVIEMDEGQDAQINIPPAALIPE